MKKFLLIAIIFAISSVAATAQVTQINANKSLGFVAPVAGTKALFASDIDNRLYVSDGTATGTVALSTPILFEDNGLALNNKVIFKGTTPATGSELYITDGTAAGTVLLKDIYAGTTGSQIGDAMALLNGNVYFTAVSPAYGRELWKTNGTTAGTTLVKDIVTGPTGSNIAADYSLFSNGSYLLFSAETTAQGHELWKSDGTEAGTVLLKDINPGAASSAVTAFFKLGNIVLFQAEHASYGEELWKADGTAAGTVLVKDIYSGPANSSSMIATFFYEFNGRAYFNATNGISGEELWSTDGTAANTNLVKDMQAGPNGSFNILINAVKVGNKFIFASTNLAGSRYGLWQSDGTTAGTTLLKDFTSGEDLPFILPAYEVYGDTYAQPLFQGNKFFVSARTPNEGSELWVSDGTEAGTVLVKNINPGAEDGIEGLSYQYTSNAFYFVANDGVHGSELWKTDGTGTGTVLVADINIGSAGSEPSFWPIFNSKLTFDATDGNNTATDLYVLNGNVSPLPVKMVDFTVVPVAADARLQWATAQEINSKEFIVQRSENGVSFTTIGTVPAAGISNNRLNYSFTDAGILNSDKATVYYRLQVVNKDGSTELTKIISLTAGGKQWNVHLMTNPVQSAILANLNGINSPATISITDVSGKKLAASVVNSNGLVTIPAANFIKGIYFLTVEHNQTTKTIRFIKD